MGVGELVHNLMWLPETGINTRRVFSREPALATSPRLDQNELLVFGYFVIFREVNELMVSGSRRRLQIAYPGHGCRCFRSTSYDTRILV